MDHLQPHSDEALRQRFRDLAESLQRVHESWQEAYGRQDLGRQLELIDREHALLAELRKVVTAFQQTLQERQASLRQLPERTPC
jgi:uncharacterized coiled-coil DUF342 family protein